MQSHSPMEIQMSVNPNVRPPLPPFTRETAILLFAAGLIAIFPWADAPVGLAASLLVASLDSRRARTLIQTGDVALQHA